METGPFGVLDRSLSYGCIGASGATRCGRGVQATAFAMLSLAHLQPPRSGDRPASATNERSGNQATSRNLCVLRSSNERCSN